MRAKGVPKPHKTVLGALGTDIFTPQGSKYTIVVTLGSKVSKYYLHWVIWIPSVTPSRMIIAVQRGGGGNFDG